MTPSDRRTHAAIRVRMLKNFKTQLFEMLRIPSLSGDPAHAGDVEDGGVAGCAHATLNLHKVAVMPTAGHPVVYGEWMGAGPDKPTVLVYGHYDVVPALMEDGWADRSL